MRASNQNPANLTLHPAPRNPIFIESTLLFQRRLSSAALPQRTKRNHLDSVIQALEGSEPAGKTDLFPILRNAAETYPRRGLMVLVSDLLVEREGLFRGLRLLRSRGHDVMVFHVLDDDELDFPFSGATRFEGLELQGQLSCNPRALRAG